MVESGQTEQKPSESIGELLREVTKLPDMLFVMGKGPQAVMEGWVDAEGTQVSVQDSWAAVESKPWHCHLHLPEVVHVRFVEGPDVHDPKRQAFSIRFLGKNDDPLLMIFFGRMYDDAGLLHTDRVARFHALERQYSL